MKGGPSVQALIDLALGNDPIIAQEAAKWLLSPERLKGQKDDLQSLRGKPGAVEAMSEEVISLLPKSFKTTRFLNRTGEN